MSNHFNNYKNEELKEIIKTESVLKFEQYISNNNLEYSDYYNEFFNVLLFSVQQNASTDIVKYILNHIPPHSMYSKIDESPLYIAFLNNNYAMCHLLLKKVIDINYLGAELVHKLWKEKNNFLNKRNIEFLLGHGLNVDTINSIFQENNSSFLKCLIHGIHIDILETIFQFFIFDNDFIIMFLGFRKNQVAISQNKLENILQEEQEKIHIDSMWYNYSIDNNLMLNLLMKYFNHAYATKIYRTKNSINKNIPIIFGRRSYIIRNENRNGNGSRNGNENRNENENGNGNGNGNRSRNDNIIEIEIETENENEPLLGTRRHYHSSRPSINGSHLIIKLTCIVIYSSIIFEIVYFIIEYNRLPPNFFSFFF